MSFPTLAFEASSFGRSDTLPRESLDHAGPWSEIRFPVMGRGPRDAASALPEEGRQQVRAEVLEDALDHLRAVIEPAVAYDVPE